jgi:hypothetical protein
MAVGDVVSNITSLATGAYLDIQPGAGIEWVIHNIYHADTVELYWYDGSNTIKFDADTTYGVFGKNAFHVTNTVWIRVKNIHASTKLVGYDGICTKA